MRVLTALEHDSIPITPEGGDDSLTPAEAERLVAIGAQRPGFCALGHRQLRLAQYCGVVGLGERVLEVLPKTHARAATEDCRAVLLRLLRLSGQFPQFVHLPAGQQLRRVPLLEAFIGAYYDAVTAVLRGGLLRQYLEHADDLRVLRGRVDMGRQLGRLANRPDAVACQFDELSADNDWNRTLKRAVRVTRPWLRGAELSRRWIELMGVLDGIDDARLADGAWERLVFDRRAERYRGAIAWARWLLSALAPTLRGGAHQAPALLFDMNRLFESAIAARLRQSAPGQGLELVSQDRSHALASIVSAHGRTEPAYVLRPDLVLMRGAQVVAVADTKWKRLARDRQGRASPAEADMYQLHAYAAAFQCRELALVYPWRAANGVAEARFALPGGATVDVLGVDVEDDGLPLRLASTAGELSRMFGR